MLKTNTGDPTYIQLEWKDKKQNNDRAKYFRFLSEIRADLIY